MKIKAGEGGYCLFCARPAGNIAGTIAFTLNGYKKE
jgi:hypothetical protein